MTKKRRSFDKGIKLRPDTSAVTEEGEVKYDDTGKKIQYRDDSTTRNVVSEDGSQTLTNKTIDADSNTVSNLEVDNLKSGVLDTDLTSVSATDDTIPSAKATKDYVDSQVASKDEASEISYDDSGNTKVVGSDVQAALDSAETEINANATAASNAQTTADDHIADASGAHAASAISNTPSGNLAATDVQGALDELQTDVDTRATDADLTAHTGASSGVHGVTGDVVGTTDTQTLTNKTIQGASIETPSRSDVKQDTKANLQTYASTATDGQTVYATDTKEFFVITDNALVEVGGGEGDVDVLTVIKDFDTSSGLTTEASGVNAGTFRLTHDPSSTEFAEKTIAVTNKFKDKILALRLDKRSTASSGNFKVIVTDETNSKTLADEVIAPQVDGVTTDKKMVTFSTAPADGDSPIASIKVRFEALAEAGAPFSEFDDVVVELNTTEKREITATVQEENVFSARIDTTTGGGILSQSSPFISSVVQAGTGIFTINFLPGHFSEKPAITLGENVRAHPGGSSSVVIDQNYTYDNTTVTINVWHELSVLVDSGEVSITATRQGSDYKNITKRVEREQSTFNEVLVEESDIYVEGAGNAGDSLTANVTDIPFTTISDNSGGWDGSVFTASEDGLYSIIGSTQATASLGYSIFSYVDGVSDKRIGFESGTTTIKLFQDSVNLSKGQTYSLRSNTSLTLSNSLSAHYIKISKVGVPKISSVAPESKVKIPTSELRMEGSSSRGSTDTFIVRFDSVSKIRGDGFSVISDATSGTKVTFNKDGYASINCALVLPSTNQTHKISLNQAVLTTGPSQAETLSTAQAYTGSSVSNTNIDLFVKAGDVIRIGADANPVANQNNNLNVTFQEQEIQVAVSNVTPQYEDADSMVRLSGTFSLGTTNTSVCRASSVVENIGSDIVYNPSASNGDSFVVQKDGYYSVSFSCNTISSSVAFITKNSSDLITTPTGLPDSEILFGGFDSGGEILESSWSGKLNAGDVVRVQLSTGITFSGSTSYNTLTIAKVGVPSIAEVDVTPFVDLNKEKLIEQSCHYQEYLGYGSTNTFVPYFNKLIESSGNELFEITNNSVDGFIVTAVKKCSITMTVNGYSSGQMGCAITKNSTEGNVSVGALTDRSVIKAWDSDSSQTSSASATIPMEIGDYLYFHSAGNFNLTTESLRDRGMVVVKAQGYEDTYERIYAVEQNENEFSARIDNNGVTASIVSQSQSFIDNVSRTGAGQITVTFINGFFTEVPSITTGAITNGGQYATIESPTLNGFVIQTRTDAGGTTDSTDIDIHVSRQGADRKDLQRQLASISDFPRVNNQLSQYISGTDANGYGSTDTRIRRLDTVVSNGDSILSAVTTSENGTVFTALRNCQVNINYSDRDTGSADHLGFSVNAEGNLTTTIDLLTPAQGRVARVVTGSNALTNASWSGKLNSGDRLRIHCGSGQNETSDVSLSILAQADDIVVVGQADRSETQTNYLTSDETANNSDVTSLKFTDLEIGDWYMLNYQGRTQTSTTTGAARLRAVHDGVTLAELLRQADSGSPVATFGTSVFFQATSDTLTFDWNRVGGSTQILRGNGTGEETFAQLTNVTAQFVVEVPVPKVAVLKDIKSSGTNGGSSISGTATRDLNSSEGDTEIVSLSSNQFTLGKGKYLIDARVPGYRTQRHQSKLRNITDSTDDIIGSTAYAHASDGQTDSNIEGVIEIVSDKTFEIQHYTSTAIASSGYGVGNSSGLSEVYTTVKITKLD